MSLGYSADSFSGDEDNGEMGAWFVLSALGLYAVAVGVTEDYVLGAAPLFPRIRLRDLDITIEAPVVADVMSATFPTERVGGIHWRKRPVPGNSMAYSVLRQGGTLRFLSLSDRGLVDEISKLRGSLNKLPAAGLQLSEEAGRTMHEQGAPDAKIVTVDGGLVMVLFAALAICMVALLFLWRKLRQRTSVEHTD